MIPPFILQTEWETSGYGQFFYFFVSPSLFLVSFTVYYGLWKYTACLHHLASLPVWNETDPDVRKG